MIENQLENIRSTIEHIEICQKAVIACFSESDKYVKKSLKKRILWDHRAAFLLRKIRKHSDEVLGKIEKLKKYQTMLMKAKKLNTITVISNCSNKNTLNESYNEPIKIIDEIGAEELLCNDAKLIWTKFYDGIKEIRSTKEESEKQYDEIKTKEKFINEASTAIPDNLSNIFTIDEAYSLGIDLIDIYNDFTNWKKYNDYLNNTNKKKHNSVSIPDQTSESNLDYHTFIKQLSKNHYLTEIPYYCKYKQQLYLKFLVDTTKNLANLYLNKHPFMDYDKLYFEWVEQFNNFWSNKSIPWFRELTCESKLYVVELDYLAEDEIDKMNILSKPSNINKINNMKSKKNYNLLVEKIKEKSIERDRIIHKQEYILVQLVNILQTNFEYALGRCNAKITGAVGDVLSESESEISDQEKVVTNYNKKHKLPLGPDGNPIPYWLYKLHGLNQTFYCEICGGQKYCSPAVYISHFNGWRHSYGLSCLGVPNIKEFYYVSQIEDALTLYKHIKNNLMDTAFNPNEDVEVEDDTGTVMSYQTYADLRSSGLI